MSTVLSAYPRELVRASAGTGKTFRISSRIIGLLAAGEAPRTILASTFTRKAAGEILERVLVRLARAALDPAAASELADQTIDDPARRGSCDPVFWRDVLHRAVRELHRLDVGTLDAFFIRAARSFGHELGLPPRWGIADEPVADRIRAEALQEVFTRLDGGGRVELVRGLAGGGVRRSVHDAVLRDLDAILAAHLALDPAGPGWDALRAVAEERPDDLPDRCTALAAALEAAPLAETKGGGAHHLWVKSRAQCVAAVRGREWSQLLGNGLFRTALEGPDATYCKLPLPPGLADLFHQAARLARVDLGAELHQRATAMGRLAGLYAGAYEEALREAGALRFEDVTRLLTGATPVGGRGDLFYRLDGDTRHILLDEFQDTSLVQWAALEPLADAMHHADEPGAAIIVADPKQSIYGWRGAAPVIVQHVGGRYALTDATLDVSYRSSQVVLDAVNRIFERLDTRWVFSESDVDRDIATDWGRAFAEHEAHFDLPGHVRIEVGPRDPGRGTQRPELMRHVADRVAELHRDAPGRSIGVLTRKNATVARLIMELRERGVEASEEGGTALTDSAAAASLLALFRLADHPGDTLAAYHVVRTPVGEAVGWTDPGDERGAERVAAQLRRRLTDDGYGHTLARLADGLRNACDARERDRLRQLTELGYRWDESPGTRVDEFVRLVEATRAASPGEGDVRVMNVHQSKGLEFDVVVLPELDGSMIGGGPKSAPLTRRPAATAPVTHAYPYMGEDQRRIFDDIPEIQEAYEQARAAAMRDALSLLYVASTRARHALHIIISEDGGKGPGTEKSHARLVREALAPDTLEDGARIDRDQVIYEAGSPDWHRQLDDDGHHGVAAVHPSDTAIPLRTGARTRGFERRSPSGHEAAGAVDLQRVLGIGADRAAMDRGTLVHAWLEEVEWIEDGLPDRERLRHIARRVAPASGSAEVDARADWLVEQVEAPAIRRALARDRYPASAHVVVENELPFIRRDGDALVEGIIDRLVLVRERGRVVRAEVLDYKTDAVEPSDDRALSDLAERYRPQLTAYARAVGEMFGLDPDAVDTTLVLVGAGRVVTPETRDVDAG